jgi:hypothetical protein
LHNFAIHIWWSLEDKVLQIWMISGYSTSEVKTGQKLSSIKIQ